MVAITHSVSTVLETGEQLMIKEQVNITSGHVPFVEETVI